MITAWSSSRMPWARSSAGPLRMLWLVITLFAFVYAHGVSAEGVTAHVDASTTTTVMTTTAMGTTEMGTTAVEDQPPADHHGGEHGQSHAAAECVPGQPQQTPVLDAPGICALADAVTAPAPRTALVAFGDVASAKQLPSTSIRATVLQI